MVKSLPAIQSHRRHGFNPWVRKIPWRRKWQPTPVFLPGKSHRQRSLEGYGRKESDTTEATLRVHTHTHTFKYMSIFLRKSWVLTTGTPLAHSPAQAEWLLSGNTTRLSPWPCKPNPSLPQGQVQSTWTSIYTQNMWEKNFHIFLLSTFDQKSK